MKKYISDGSGSEVVKVTCSTSLIIKDHKGKRLPKRHDSGAGPSNIPGQLASVFEPVPASSSAGSAAPPAKEKKATSKGYNSNECAICHIEFDSPGDVKCSMNWLNCQGKSKGKRKKGREGGYAITLCMLVV